jgi:hypothetical protein
MDGNTLISLKVYGVIDAKCDLTEFGLLDANDEEEAHARRCAR